MSPKEYFQTCYELTEQEESFVCVTLVDIVLSAPQELGAKMIVTRNGLYAGTVGGGKLEAHAIQHAQAIIENHIDSSPCLEKWNLKKDIGMTCGGEVSLFFEAHEHNLWQIVVFGAGHVAQKLVPLLLTLSCKVTCYDTRCEWLDRLPEHPRLSKKHCQNLASVTPSLPAASFIISMTQGHSHDLPILSSLAKQTQPPYIGVIGSSSKSIVLKRELIKSGAPTDFVDSIHCPIGLDIGSRQPSEIAISIAAQLLQKRDEIKTSKRL